MSSQPPTARDDSLIATLARTGLPLHNARDLTGPDGTALILLDDKAYTLRITKAGKLILTK